MPKKLTGWLKTDSWVFGGATLGPDGIRKPKPVGLNRAADIHSVSPLSSDELESITRDSDRLESKRPTAGSTGRGPGLKLGDLSSMCLAVELRMCLHWIRRYVLALDLNVCFFQI